MSTLNLLRTLYRYKAWANDELLAAVEKVDAQAHADARHTMLRVLNHIHVVDRIFRGHLSGEGHAYTATNTPETPTLEALHTSVQEVDRWYLGLLDTLSPAQLGEALRFTFTDGAKGTMTREEMLLHVHTHGAYHRGAVGQLLKQVGIAPPRDLITGFLHQSEPARREHG